MLLTRASRSAVFNVVRRFIYSPRSVVPSSRRRSMEGFVSAGLERRALLNWQAPQCEHRPDDEDRRGQVDEAKVADRVEAPGIERGQRHQQGEDGRGHRAYPGPHVAAAYPEPGQENHCEPERGEET